MTFLHAIFQEHHITPDDYFSKPRKIKAFMIASMHLRSEDEKAAKRKAEQEAKKSISKKR